MNYGNLINFYFKKTLLGNISFNYKYKIKKNYYIDLKCFYWLYLKIYNRNIKGLCIKNKNNLFFNMESFLIYYRYKDLKINQLYFKSSPYNFFIKYKNKKKIKVKKIYII